MSAAITAAEASRAEIMREAVRTHCPEMVPILKDLGRNGLIEGWRNVTAVLDVGPPRPVHGIDATVFLENCEAQNMNKRGAP